MSNQVLKGLLKKMWNWDLLLLKVLVMITIEISDKDDWLQNLVFFTLKVCTLVIRKTIKRRKSEYGIAETKEQANFNFNKISLQELMLYCIIQVEILWPAFISFVNRICRFYNFESNSVLKAAHAKGVWGYAPRKI